MKRLVGLLTLVLLLDLAGLFPPNAVCEADQVGAFTCTSAVEAALSALPPGHAAITAIQFIGLQCEGYCPLLRHPYIGSVVIIFADHTRSTIGLYPEGERLVAEFNGFEPLP